MLHEATLGEVGILGAGTAVVGVGIDGDASTGREETDDLDVLGVHQPHQVFHDGVHAVLMEIAVVAEGEEVELQALRLHHALTGDIENLYLRKVRLARDGTERSELRAVELHPIVVVGMTVSKRLQHLRSIVHLVFRLAAQLLQALIFSCHSSPIFFEARITRISQLYTKAINTQIKESV